jgi:hypothetical protein
VACSVGLEWIVNHEVVVVMVVVMMMVVMMLSRGCESSGMIHVHVVSIQFNRDYWIVQEHILLYMMMHQGSFGGREGGGKEELNRGGGETGQGKGRVRDEERYKTGKEE